MFTALIFAGLLHSGPLGSHHRPIDVPPNGQHTYTLNDPAVDGFTTLAAVTWIYTSAGLADEDFVQICDNRCLGATHTKHEDCNKFCDRVCQKLQHDFNFNAESFDFGVGRFVNAFNKDGGSFGVKGDLSKFGSDVAKQVDFTMHDGRYKISEKVKCWNNDPCTNSEKGYYGKAIDVTVSYQFYKIENGADGKPKTTQGPSNRMKLRTYDVPDISEPLEAKYPVCFCERMKLPPTKTAFQWTGGIYYGETPGSEVVPASALKNYNFEMTFDSMNSFTVKGSNMTSMPVTLYVMPGTECEPSDSGYQTMMTTEKIVLELKPFASTAVTAPMSLASGSGLEIFAEGYGVCLNMLKKEPDSSVKYKPLTVSTTELRRLAKYASKERFKGPWTQTRFWIVTDNATLDEIGKVLRPRPTEGMYLRSLYQAATVARLDFTTEARRRCLEPKFIAGATATKEGTLWFVQQMAKIDAKGLSSWIDSNPDSFKPLFASDATEVELGHAVDVANALVGSSNESLRKSGFGFLSSVIPSSHREAFVKAGGLEEVERLLMGEEPVAATQALEVLEAYRSKSSLLALYNVSPKAPAELKERAAKLAKVLNQTPTPKPRKTLRGFASV